MRRYGYLIICVLIILILSLNIVFAGVEKPINESNPKDNTNPPGTTSENGESNEVGYGDSCNPEQGVASSSNIDVNEKMCRELFLPKMGDPNANTPGGAMEGYCAPIAGSIALKQISKCCGLLKDDLLIEDIARKIALSAGTTTDEGTLTDNFINAIKEYLFSSGLKCAKVTGKFCNYNHIVEEQEGIVEGDCPSRGDITEAVENGDIVMLLTPNHWSTVGKIDSDGNIIVGDNYREKIYHDDGIGGPDEDVYIDNQDRGDGLSLRKVLGMLVISVKDCSGKCGNVSRVDPPKQAEDNQNDTILPPKPEVIVSSSGHKCGRNFVSSNTIRSSIEGKNLCSFGRISSSARKISEELCTQNTNKLEKSLIDEMNQVICPDKCDYKMFGPVYDVNIRSPSCIQNRGSDNAFISCNLKSYIDCLDSSVVGGDNIPDNVTLALEFPLGTIMLAISLSIIGLLLVKRRN